MRLPTCLFLINGLGLGNSTRCHAVIDALADAGVSVHVITSGNGLAYFQHHRQIESLTPMDSFFYSGKNGGVSGWSTLKSLGALLRIARAKRHQLEELLDRLQPDVAVIDSEYSIGPLRQRRIPIIGLNTSEMVVTQYLKHRRVPSSVRSQFWLVEFLDYMFHRHCCDQVLSPFPLRTSTRHPKFRRIGLIIRPALKDRFPGGGTATWPEPRALRHVTFMLSGSMHASRITFDTTPLSFQAHVVGIPGQSKAGITYYGRQMDNIELLTQADALVINGGYSAVSEAIFLGKPAFVVPVAGHAEQFVNAHLVEQMGLGFVASEADVLAQIRDKQASNSWGNLPTRERRAFQLDGAREAADLISAMAQRSCTPIDRTSGWPSRLGRAPTVQKGTLG